MYTIACVLKHKGDFYNHRRKVEYDVGDVQWLAEHVAEHVTLPCRFVCLSDVELGLDCVERVPLLENWPGWWSKLELFRPGLFTGNVLYLDLDTAVIGNIDDWLRLPTGGGFWMLSGLTEGLLRRDQYGSGVMAWNGDYSHLYRAFKADSETHMATYVEALRWGDQGFIAEHQPDKRKLQESLPGQLISYKIDYLQGKPLDGVKIVCFHGKPKPKQVSHSWLPPY
jgi:hypothetical protein